MRRADAADHHDRGHHRAELQDHAEVTTLPST
jgi:hypothetical protein